jgi:hypothetical protein
MVASWHKGLKISVSLLLIEQVSIFAVGHRRPVAWNTLFALVKTPTI